jgi:hypothetical protein
MAEHDTVRCAERSRQPRVDRAVCPWSAPGAHQHTFVPYILTPCFPSYPSNHGSASNSAAEILKRVYGAGGHAITMANPAVPGLTFHYTRFNQITDDISDARVYGGIHFRFDQEAGADLGRDIGTYVYNHNLRRAKPADKDDDGDNDDEHDGRSRRRD